MMQFYCCGVSMSGKVIALLQKKGGAAKTTTGINLLGALIEQGFNCVLCDMDKDKPDAVYWADKGDELIEHVIPLFDENPKPKILDLKQSYQYILIDTPPNFEAAALKAAMLCDIAIIPSAPVETEKRALQEAAACALMADKPYRFLASRVFRNTNLAKIFFSELEKTGTSFKTYITNSVAMSECQKKGQWVGSYAPNQQNHIQYKELVREVIEILGG